ncbi:hypothetical protein WDW89_16955 [Deltaproteobacteria bacterium TL4]
MATMTERFVSQQRDKAKEALQDVFNPKSRDEEVLFYLPVTKRWLKQVVLGLILLCHSSYRGVIEFFRNQRKIIGTQKLGQSI